jgi:hypothetical protein
MSERVGRALRAEVRERAGKRCEYCGMPNDMTLLAVLWRFADTT